MDTHQRLALGRGAKDKKVGRATLAVVAVLAAAALVVATTHSGALTPSTTGSAGGPGSRLTQADLAASRLIGAREPTFWMVHAAKGLQARNTDQRMRASFTRAGVRFDTARGQAGLSLAAVGRGTRLSRVGAATPGADANRVAYAHGGVAESYTNGPLGLEQSLVVGNRPAPAAGGELTLSYALSGQARLRNGLLSFLAANGTPVLRYGALSASDARGHVLASHLQLQGSRLLIRIADAGAKYPIKVDPLIQLAHPDDLDGSGFGNPFAGLRSSSLALVSSTALSLSLTPLNSTGAAWSTADEGIGQPLGVKVTITNPQFGQAVTNVTPAAFGLTPTTALTATGGPTPAIPAGGFSISPGNTATFTVPYVIKSAGDAVVSDSITWHDANGAEGPVSGMTTIPLGSAATGTVYNLKCGDTSCSRTGVGGANLLALGKATDGTAVSRTGTSADDGTFTLGVPAGTDTVGPTQDSKTLDGAGFDPLNHVVTVPAAAPVAGQDFNACALSSELGSARRPDSVSSTGTGTGIAADSGAAKPVQSDAASGPTATACKSIYTVKVSAKIPQAQLVDPSTKAAYEVEHGGGFNPTTRKSHAFSPGFPACFSAAQVKKYTNAGASAEWFTHIKGGPLGSASASFAWDRKAQEVHVVDGPTLTVKKMTRIFDWKIHDHGKTLHGSCNEVNHVQELTLPVGGSDVPGSGLTSREFALITVWGFPFNPVGDRVDPDTLAARTSDVAHRLYAFVQAFDKAIEDSFGEIPGYKQLPHLLRFGIEFGASYLLGSGIVSAAAKAPGLATKFFEGAKYLPQLLEGLKAAEELSHGAHKLKSLQEVVAYLSGFAAKGEYPVMGSIIRGRFLVSGYTKLNNTLIPLDSMLGLSVKTTNFPTISLHVSRNAEANLDPNNPVTTGPLPWKSMASKQLDIFNKLSDNPTNVLVDASGKKYDDGLEGVEEVHADTKQLPELTKAVEEHDEEGTALGPELGETDVPDCEAFTALPAVGTSICYDFLDGRP
jgi:hypothetical protein